MIFIGEPETQLAGTLLRIKICGTLSSRLVEACVQADTQGGGPKPTCERKRQEKRVKCGCDCDCGVICDDEAQLSYGGPRKWKSEGKVCPLSLPFPFQLRIYFCLPQLAVALSM
ncbi:hypothetical protein HZ326_14475 [Fusarium oxysporum f. sp. albedinis]|nr:hypothetical protein HZ326_14475 [Fusarium oxysporum f. sp. albedinis]